MRVGQGDIFLRGVRGLYEREFKAISEYIYYSFILRGKYPYIADLFDSLAIAEIDALKTIGEILRDEGKDTSVDLRVRLGYSRGKERIDEIIKLELGRIKEGMRECERLLASSVNIDQSERISRAISVKAEALECLDRMLRS